VADETDSRPGVGTGAASESDLSSEDHSQNTAISWPVRPRSSNASSDPERILLSLMTTTENMAKVIESGIGAEVFEDPMTRLAFIFMLDYWRSSEKAPTWLVMEQQCPSVPLERDVEETTDWCVEWLQKRHERNRIQDIVRRAAQGMDKDANAALRLLRDESTAVLEQAGRSGSSFDDEFLLADQLDSLPAPEPLIADVLNRHTYGILRGRDQSFKSFVALDWSLCMGTGTPWQGKPVERVKVLYVAGEGAHGIGERKRAWESAHDLKIDPKWFVVRRSAVNLYRAGPEVDHLLELVEREEFGLVVFDTLRRMSGGAAENSSDMGVVVDNLDRVKRVTADGSVLAVAHTDKGDNDSRGYSGIEDDADIVWSAKRENNTNELTLTCAKMKDGPDGHQFDLRMRTEGGSLVVESADTVRRSGLFAQDREGDQIIMATMREVFATDGATVKDLMTMTELSQASVYRSRARLLESGRLWSNKAHRLFLRTTEEAE
jgi:hypothetical protein